MRLDHLLSKEFCFGTARRTVKGIRFIDVLALSFLAKRDGVLAWHAVGVLEQRSGPDPTGLDSHCLWLFVWCGCVGCELYSGREHL